jgi:siderophore synthetase component
MKTSMGPTDDTTTADVAATDRAREAAADAAAETLLNCYLREGGVWRPVAAGDVPQLAEEGDEWLAVMPFPNERTMLLAGIRHLSPTQRHRFRLPAKVAMAGGSPWTVSLDTLAGMLADELGDTGLGDELSAPGSRGPDPTFLLARVRESVATASTFLRAREDDIEALFAPEPLSFIASEQASLLGDIAHPTTKSRWEMSPEQVEAYAPETAARFALRWLAVDPALVEHDSATGVTAPQLTERLLRDDPAVDAAALDAALEGLGERVLLPVHPWEFEHLREQADVAALIAEGLVTDLGELGSAVTPTSTVRTVYNAEWPWQLTFSLHVNLTDGMPIARPRELERAVDAARQLSGDVGEQAAQLAPEVVLLSDPAYIAVRRDGELVEGLSVQLRENRWRGDSDIDVSAVGILAQDHPYGGASRLAQIVTRLAADGGRSEEEVAREWFRRYCDVVIAPLVRLHLGVGLAIDADQRTMLLELEDGWPARAVLREGHGYLEPGADAGAAIEALVPLAVINALGVAGLASEQDLLGDLKAVLERERDRGGRYPTTLLDHLLDEPTWRCAAPLRRRLEDREDVFATIVNPLHRLDG